MNNILIIYLLTSLISFIIITTTITIPPIISNAQTEQKNLLLQIQQKSISQQQEQPLVTSPSCGQVITQNVELTSNFNCADNSDGLIVGASDIVIDLNGYTISGPDVNSKEKTSNKVGIMVPNANNIVIKDGTIQGFRAGIIMTGSQNVELNNIVSKDNQIGAFSMGANIVNVHLSILENNQIGFAGYTTQQTTVENNLFYQNTLAGITLSNSDNGTFTLNSITESGNGLYVDNQSNNNNINFNNVLLNSIDINNANGLPVNTNENIYDQNNCNTSTPSGICIGN